MVKEREDIVWDEHAQIVVTCVEHSLSLLKAYVDELTVRTKEDKLSREYRKYSRLSSDLNAVIYYLLLFKDDLEEFKEEKKLPDMEKVVKGMEQCCKEDPNFCKSCPYYNIDECYNVVLAEALELLKEKEC